MALKIYLDTSVVSAYFDDRYPERQKDTVAFWKLSVEHEFSISELTKTEIQNTQDETRKNQMLNHIGNLILVPIDDSVEHLTNLYLENGIFSPATLNDALHVATATISRQDILVHRGKRSCAYQFDLRLSLRHGLSRNPEGFKSSVCMSDGNLYAERLTPRCTSKLEFQASGQPPPSGKGQ